MTLINQFWNDRSGATAIEYALIAGLISISLVAIVATAGTSVVDLYTRVSTELTQAFQ